MAGGTQLSGFFSTYDVKDNATKTIQKINAEEKKLSKTLTDNTKSVKNYAKERENAHKEILKAQQEIAKNEKKARDEAQKEQEKNKQDFRNTLGQRAGGIYRAAAGADVVGILSSIVPVLGPLIQGMSAAVDRAVAAISQSANITQARSEYGRATDISPGLGKLQAQLGGKFATNDIQESVRALSQAGIFDLTDQQIKTISKEAGRLGSVSAVIREFQSGRFEQAGQAGEISSLQLQSAPRQGLGAPVGFELFAKLTEGIHENTEIVKKQVTSTNENLNFTKRALDIERADQERAIQRANKDVESVYNLRENTNVKLEGVLTDLAPTLVSIVETGVDEAVEVAKHPVKSILNLVGSGIGGPAGQFIQKMLNGKASGGSVHSGQPTLVGEKGPEIFTPQNSGSITPNNQLQRGGSSPNLTMNVTINGAQDPESIVQIMRQKFTELINSYANTTLALELGLPRGLS